MRKIQKFSLHTACTRSVAPFYIITSYMKWAKTSWTYSTQTLLVRRLYFIIYSGGAGPTRRPPCCPPPRRHTGHGPPMHLTPQYFSG